MTEQGRCPDFAALLREVSPTASLTEQIVSCFSGEMTRAAQRYCQDGALAEDAAQEALLTLVEHLPEFRGDAPIDTWLRRLVRSSCSRLRRGRKNDPAFNLPLDEAPTDIVPAEPPEQELRVQLEERLSVLREVLERIAEPDRSLFLLHEDRELSLAALAGQFGLSVDAVKARLKRTRAAIRVQILAMAEGSDRP